MYISNKIVVYNPNDLIIYSANCVLIVYLRIYNFDVQEFSYFFLGTIIVGELVSNRQFNKIIKLTEFAVFKGDQLNDSFTE